MGFKHIINNIIEYYKNMNKMLLLPAAIVFIFTATVGAVTIIDRSDSIEEETFDIENSEVEKYAYRHYRDLAFEEKEILDQEGAPEPEITLEEDKSDEELTEQSGQTNKENNSTSENESASKSFELTAYTSMCEGCSGITFSGYDVRNTIYSNEGRRVIAVDPDVIPLHSVVEIKKPNGNIIEAKALDTGGLIKNRVIDLLVSTKDEAWSLGRQSVKVRILN